MMVNTVNLNNNYLFNKTSPVSNANSMYNLLSLSYGAKGTSFSQNSSKTLSAAAQNFVTEAKSQSENLKLALASLTGTNKSPSLFNMKTAVSSDTDVMTVKSPASQKNFIDMSVNIKQVATTQKNTGFSLNATDKDFTAGYKQIQIESNGKKTQVSFTINARDDNQTSLQKMADAINSRGAGVMASVVTDSVTKKSTLSIESLTTGAADSGNKFNITDVSGNAVQTSGAENVKQEAQNAIYNINGGEDKESKSNNVDIGNGVTATFKKATTEPVTVSFANDKTASVNKIREMVNAFNGLMAAADDNSADRRSKNLIKELNSVASAYMQQMNRAGISVNENGYLAIDEKKMDKAAESGDLKKLFTGEGANANYGFSYRLSKVADKVNQNPMSYVTNEPSANANQNGLNGQFGGINLNFSQIMKMDQMSNIGMLFEMFA